MQQVRIDFDNPGLPQSLGVVEGESQSRIFQAALYKSGAAYTAPAGAVYSIMYRGFGPQNQGWYDTIEDGAGKRAACTVSGNVVTCELARQALRVPGHLTVVLCVSDAKGYMLKSWPIMADARNDGYEDTGEIEMYFNLSGLAGNYLTQLEKAMADAETTKNTLTSTSAQVQKDIDAKAAAALESIPEEYTELDGSVKQLKEDVTCLGNVENVSMSVISDIHHGIYKKLYDTINVYYVSDGTSKPTSTCRGLKYHIVGKYIRLRGELGGATPSVAQYAWGTFSSWATNAWTYYTDSKAVDTVLEVPNGESFLYINVVPEKIDSIRIDVYGDTKNNNVLGVDVTVVTPINESVKPMHQFDRLSGADKQYLTITQNDLDNNCYTISINNTTNSQIAYMLGGGADQLLTNKIQDKAYFVLEYTCNNEAAITVSATHISAELPRDYVFKQGLNVVYGSINNANARVSVGVTVKPNQQVSINITKIAYIFDNDNISYNDVVRYATTWTSWVDYKRGTHKLYKPVSDNSAIKAYSGKTWVKYGDSLSALPWGATIAEKLGMTMINKSIGGTRATYTGSSATNDNAGCAISRLQTLPEKIDVITIGFGANDWSGTGVEIGSLPDHVTVDTELDNTVFIDAMLIILKYICTNYPEATVILITPPFGFGVDNMGNPGRTKLDYGNAIKEIAQRFGCGIVDWYKDMGVNIYNYSHFFDGDDLVHFNVNGQKRMESLIYAELVRLANISL